MLQDTVDQSSSFDTPNLCLTARPKAQARAQPKALNRQRTQSDLNTLTSPPLSSVLSVVSMASINNTDTATTAAATASKALSTLPPWDLVTRLLLDSTSTPTTIQARSMPIWATHSLILRVKFELLFAYGMVHVHNKLENCDLESEPEWNASIKDGSLSRLMDVIFVARGINEDEDALFYRSLLTSAFGMPGT